MTPAEYSRVKEVFARAIDMPRRDREAYLKKACGKDTEIYAEVSSLLEHHRDETIISESEPEMASIEVTTSAAPDATQVLVPVS